MPETSEKKIMFGDKLPGCLLSEEEWRDICAKVENVPSKEEAFELFRGIAQKHCVGENSDTCWLCGEKSLSHTHSRSFGLCNRCYKAFYYRGVLRQHGRVRGSKNSDTYCIVCGKNRATTKGMCRNCYYYARKHHIDDIETLRKLRSETLDPLETTVLNKQVMVKTR